MDKLKDIYIATFSNKAEETARKYGFGLEINDLCISSNLEEEKREWLIDRIQGELEKANAFKRKAIMHGPFTELTPSAIDPLAIDLMRKRYRSTLDICSHFGIRDIVLHDGYIPLIYQKPWHLKRSILFWTEFAEEIPDGTRVYIENVFDDEPDLLLEIVETVNEKLMLPQGKEKYRICLDIGHANAMSNRDNKSNTENIIEWIIKMGPLIGHFHLHNNDGTGDLHDDVNSGTLIVEDILSAIEKYCREDVTMTIESRNAEPSAKYLYDYYSKR